MKYAFILGSNSYIVPSNTISFSEGEEPHNFLRIVSVHRDTPPDQPRAVLTIDAEFKDNEGHLVRIKDNKPEVSPGLEILEQPDRVLITKSDGHVVLDVHQMDHKTAMRLEHNIVAELEVHAPVVPIRLRGHFVLGNLHIEIDNEKLFIGKDAYGNSTLAGHNDLRFSDTGVLI